MWIQRRLPTSWARTPTADLAVLGIPTARYLGQRAAFFLVGLVFPTLFVALLTAFGWQLPFTVPVLAGIVIGALLSLLPAYNAKSDAAVAREEFTRAVGAFTDLTALERQAGAGTTQALESAAAVGDSWVFVRIREELAQARWAGKPPWDALSELGAALQVPGLADLGDIMRMSGEQGVAVYDSLRARAASNRDAVLAADHARANRASEALTMPTAALGVIFLLLLATPAVIRIALGYPMNPNPHSPTPGTTSKGHHHAHHLPADPHDPVQRDPGTAGADSRRIRQRDPGAGRHRSGSVPGGHCGRGDHHQRRHVPGQPDQLTHRDRGSLSLELVILVPVMLLVIFGAIQTALHYHARNVAQSAAAEAVTAGTTTRGTTAAAREAADSFIATASDGILTDTTVAVNRTATTVTATVQGHSLAVLPLLPTPLIRQTVSGTIEQPPT